jgi:hypothetical protein
MRMEKAHINKIRNKKGEIRAYIKEIQGIIKDYFNNLYSNKLENPEEMDIFLDTYDHPKLNQEDIKHLSGSIICNEIEIAIESTKKRKVQDLTDSPLNSTRPLKKN